MHICFDHQIFGLQEVGGISRYFLELARRLPSHPERIQTTVLAPLHINDSLASSEVTTIGKKIISFPGKHRILPFINRRMSGFFLKNIGADIFHETYYSSYSQSVGIPRVLTVYDMIHERFPEQFNGPDCEIPTHKAAAVARADHIIVISQSTRNDLIHFLGVAEEKITVIPLASSFGANPTSPGKEKLGRPYLLYVGLRQGVKNFSTLLQAFAQSKVLPAEYDLLCVGGGPLSSDERLAINKAGVQQQVKQLEADDLQLERLYGGASLFVYPSLYEGFGLPLLEAMRCGCPVLCSNTSSMPEIAGEAALYFNPTDEEELRDLLERTVGAYEKQDILRNHGYQREKLFSWEKCVAKTADLYGSLV